MKLKQIFFSISCLTVLFGCDFGGVTTNSTDNTIVDSIDIINSTDLTIDSIAIEEPFSLLNDTIKGLPNNMVYNGDKGLRVEWTKKNENDPIKLNDVVMVNYTARVAAGEEYDSNKEMGFPAPLKTNIGMIVEGWEKGLLQMNIGDIGRIMIPNTLAYGETGYSTIIPPGADLIIEIEIVSRVEPIILDEGVKVYTWKKNETGKTPVKNQVISFDYFAYTVGKKGKLYDNSFKDSQPFSFNFENDNVIDGLHQGMRVIKADENAFIEIPYKHAYGSKGLVDLVPKNTNIVYDVRILSID